MKAKHKWSYADNLLVLKDFFKSFRNTDYDLLISRISDKIGTSPASVKMKISNMIYILSNGKHGHSNYSEDSRIAVFKFLENNPDIEINRLIMILK